MSFTNEEARTELLEELAAAISQLALAVACLSEAYEQVDEASGDRLEAEMFRPVQRAYARSVRTYTEFAARYRLPEREFETRSPGLHSEDPAVYIQRAIDGAEQADHLIAELQDSLLPVDVGDTELRAGLSETRTLIDQVPVRGRQLLRTVGR